MGRTSEYLYSGKVGGGEAGVEFPINHYLTFEAADTYDDVQKNKATIGVRLTLNAPVDAVGENILFGILNDGDTVTANNNTLNLSETINPASSANDDNIGMVNTSNGNVFNAYNNTVNFLGTSTIKICILDAISGSGNIYNNC